MSATTKEEEDLHLASSSVGDSGKHPSKSLFRGSVKDPAGGERGTVIGDLCTSGDNVAGSVEKTTQVEEEEGIMKRSVEDTRRALQKFHQSMRTLPGTAGAAAAAATPQPILPEESDDKSSPNNDGFDDSINTLSFENLTVLVPESGWKHCNCRGSPIRHYATDYLGVAVERTDAFFAMDGISGYVASGEILLVLTSNEMAASTLLRALTGRLSSSSSSSSSRTSDQLSGSLLWNGIEVHAHYLQPWRRLAPYVSARDDSHAAVLTVRETLQFAAECMAGVDTPKAVVTDRVQQLMEALGIDHVADTVVGDENLRGISGGQKRRVTVGEMMLNPHAMIYGLENITDGLASTDSYNLIERLASATSVMKTSAVVSLLQPSDEIVELFDKLLVIDDEGKLAYFGPTDREVLRQVFLGPDVDITQDSGSICDLVLGKVGDPVETSKIRERFQSTQAFQDMQHSLTEIRTGASKDRSLQKFLPSGKYSCTWHRQMDILARRRIKLIARNAVTYTRIVIAILFSVIIGSLFSVLNNDLMGSMSRTGYWFLNCFLVLMLSAAITIPSIFRDRVTLFKHRSAEFYSGRIAYITQMLLDAPLSILEAFLLASISYYWVDMQSGANHFLNFVGVLIGLEFVGQAFGRFLCAVCRKQVSANSLSSVVILFFGTVAGFMPTYGQIPPIFRWLSWITPASYAFESIMINEFAERNISLAVIASPEGSVSVGQLAGESWLQTFSLPREEWRSLDAIKLFDLFFLFILAVVFDIFGCYYVELCRGWYFNQTRRTQRTAKSLDFEKQDKVRSSAKSNSEQGEDNEFLNKKSTKHWPQSLSVEELCYFVPLKKKARPKRFNLQAIFGPFLVRLARKEKGEPSQSLHEEDVSELQLLRDIKGRFRAGQMTALMGTSGAGKSTLLDVIAGYKTAGRTSGTVLIGGTPKETKVWKSISGYAEQQDVINPYMSTLETLRFTAACRLQSSDRATAVSDVIRLMNLEEFQDVVVGKEVEAEGLPKHARKRLTIAIQLVTKPRILFCDEPTTGLSTQAANLVMNAIRRVTDELQLITVATIHQPSKIIWDSFDDLLLLVKGGQLAYMGDISRSMDYFCTLTGLQPPPQVNPADFVLSAVENVSVDDAVSAFQKSDLITSLELEIENDKASMQPSNHQSIVSALEKAERGKNVWKEIILLAKRHLLTQWRNPSYSFMRLSASIGVSLYMGILFISDKSVIDGAVLSIGAIFFFVFVLVIPMQATVVPLIEDRAVLYREATSGLYTRFSYGFGQLLADLPFHALNALLMFVCFYFIVDFRREVDLIGYFILMLFLANWVVMSIGQLFAFATPNEESANGLSGLAVILSVILMGFLITVSAMPSYWEWAYWANLYHYIIQGLVTNELAGKTFLLELAPDVNATSAFVPEPGTDLSDGSTAMQTGSFLNLALLAGPGINLGIAESGFGALANLVDCMVANTCFVGEDSIMSFLRCFIFPRAPCADEFNTAVEKVDFEEVLKCFAPSTNATNFDTDTVPTDVFDGTNRQSTSPGDLTEEAVDEMTESDRLELVLCLMRALLPPGVTEIIQILLKVFEALFDVVFFVLDIIQNGINIPGELILFVFGWANFEDGEFNAPYKWFYCLTSVVIFLGSIELFKLFAVTCIVWTKR